MVNTFSYNAPRNKNFGMHTPWDKNFLLSKNANFSTKKFLPPFHTKLKFFCLLHMIAHSYSYHASKNQIFILHWNWDKNFLLSKNPNFSKSHKWKISTSLPLPDKIMKPWWMMVNTFPYNASRNKNFILHWKRSRIFLLSHNTNFTSKKFLPPFHCQLKFFCLLHMMAQLVVCHPPRNKNFSMQWNGVKIFLL